MINFFKKLREDEVKLMYKGPTLVTVLIAGADDRIDNKEIKEAIEFTKLGQSKGKNLMVDFYKEIAETFEHDLKELIHTLPEDAEARNPVIVEELRRLNIILPKLDRQFAIQYYESMQEIASAVAKASGGILGYMSVGFEEARYVDLNFIRNPARYKKPEAKPGI